VLGRVAVSGEPEIEPGASAFVRIRLESPAVLTRGDRFILRAYSPPVTIAGGSVLDPAPPRTGVRTAAGRARFVQLSAAGDEPLQRLVDEAGIEGLFESALVSRGGVPGDEASGVLARLVNARTVARAGQVLIAPARIAALKQALLTALADYHRGHPLVEGMPREEARERLFGRAPQAVFDLVVGELVAAKQIVARDRLALSTHTLALSDEEALARDVIERSYRDAGLKPPEPQAVAAQSGVKPDVAQRITTLLVRQKVLARVDALVFHEEVLRRLKEEVRSLRRDGQTVTIDVATFKDHFGITRKFAIPLLEYLDRERVTRRVGDTRQIIAS
jgi:selenocysteine-specific elongation factor